MRRTLHMLLTTLRRLWKDPQLVIWRWIPVVLLFVAVFGDFIANDKPLYSVLDGNRDFPAMRHVFSQIGLSHWTLDDRSRNWSDAQYSAVIFAPIPYSASSTDLRNANFVGPFETQQIRSTRFRHWLGTDHLGRDVVAGLIHGTRVALVVSILSMLLAALVGIPVGAMAGYLGDSRLRITWSTLFIRLAGVLLSAYFLFLALSAGGAAKTYAYLALGITVLCVIALPYIADHFLLPNARAISFPADSFVLRMIEVIRSIPAFFLLFAILGMLKTPRLLYVVFLIAFLSCPSIIRFVRAEALKLRSQTFIQSARVIGLPDWKIIVRHILPNAIGPALITIAFGMGSAILIESALSFLGIGIAPDAVTWGKMLNAARSNFGAWWMAILPGTAIFVTIALFNKLGERLEQYTSGQG